MNPVQQALIRKIESDRQLAIYVDNAMVGVQEVAYDTTEVIGLGFDRTVKHFSYFFSGYEDVNEKTIEENKRFFKSLDFFSENRDPILEMIDIYVKQSVARLNESEVWELIDILKNSLKVPVKISANYAIGKLTRDAISATVTEAIYAAILRNEIARQIIKGVSSSVLFALRWYGVIEKASIAKDDLKIRNPLYYWSLYSINIEMLYFLIEPYISDGLYLIGRDKYSPAEIARAFNTIVSKSI